MDELIDELETLAFAIKYYEGMPTKAELVELIASWVKEIKKVSEDGER